MEPEKVLSTTPTKPRRRIGWRILLAILANIGMLSFGKGLGEILHYRKLMGGPEFLWFVWPYAALALVCCVFGGLAILGRLRISIILMLVAFMCSLALFEYDIAHPWTRSQIVESNGPSYYVFWSWWSRWGWKVLQ